MQSKTLKRKILLKRIIINIIMVSAILVTVTVITLFALGYRFDTNKGHLEQNAFLQFDSIPSGATVSIDGAVTGSKTPNKSSVSAGKHTIVMWRDGYQTWRKTISVKSGTLTWLNYTLLVPKTLTVEPVASYTSVYATLSSPKGKYMLVQPQVNIPTFKLVDLSSDNIVSIDITIPTKVYSESTVAGVAHMFKIEKWDDGERYVIIGHAYDNKNEWIVLDTQNPSQTKNVTQLFDLGISKIVFSDNSGNNLYAMDSGDIRKLDLNAGTISKPIVSNVSDFDFYLDRKIITYVGNGKSGTNQRVAGLYREGDNSPAIVRTVKINSSVPLHIATTYYFNENYVAISEGNQVDVLSGSYPNTTSDNTNSMKVIASFKTQQNINDLSFSPRGEYVLVQSSTGFASYDLEYQKLAQSKVVNSGAVTPLKWLDENHVWSGAGGKLSICDFDGTNIHTINTVLSDQDATLTNNGRFLYSINKSTKDYQLQRVRMILP